MFMNYHIARLVLSSFCVRAFGAVGFRWFSFCRLSLQNELRTRDRCGNSSTQSQAPDDGYINVRNMLST